MANPSGNFESITLPPELEELRQELIKLRDDYHKRLVAGSL